MRCQDGKGCVISCEPAHPPEPLTSASATAASRSVLVLKTRMAFTEPGILPDWPSPNRSIQKQKQDPCQPAHIFSVLCQGSCLLPLQTERHETLGRRERHWTGLPVVGLRYSHPTLMSHSECFPCSFVCSFKWSLFWAFYH